MNGRKVKTRLRKSFLFNKPIHSNRAITHLLINSNNNDNNNLAKIINNKKISEKILYKKNRSIDNKNIKIKYNLDNVLNNSKFYITKKNDNNEQKKENSITINNNIIINYNKINNNSKANKNNYKSNFVKENNKFNIIKENNNKEEPKILAENLKNQITIIPNNNFISNKDTNKKNNTNSFFITSNTPKNKPSKKFIQNYKTLKHLSIKDKISSFSFESNSKIYKKIEINPYNNFNTIKKYFIYRLKKFYVLKKRRKTDNSPLSFNNNNNNKDNFFNLKKNSMTSTFLQFSPSQKVISHEAKKLLYLDNGNIQINEYLIYKDKILGIGQNSKVYLAQNIKSKKLFAIKIKNSKVFQNQIEIVKRIHCKYIVELYEILQTSKDSYIVLELMENNSLFNSLDDLDIFCIWKYFRNLVSAIEHCHEIAKIVNLNINLKDCLISQDDILKLTNFSQAKILGDDGNIIINEKEFIDNYNKNISYPPEIDFNECEGNNDNIVLDGKSIDVWMLGNLLFTLIFGESFVDNNIQNNFVFNINNFDNNNNIVKNNEIYNSHITFKTNNYDLSKIDSEDKQLDKLIKGMLEYNPQQRYSIEDIKKDNWTTKDGEFPMPDIEEEALEYFYKITSEEVIKANGK